VLGEVVSIGLARVLLLQVSQTLEQAAIDQYTVTIDLEQVFGPGNGGGGTPERSARGWGQTLT
jgi:hypothetical protein